MFGNGRQISVSSVAYNMAGAEENRPNYLKSLVIGNVLSGTKDSISQTLQNGYLHGPVTKFKQFYRWARKPENYGLIGIPDGKIGQVNQISSILVQDTIARILGFSPWVQRAQIGGSDISMWAEQYLLIHHPDALNNDWSADRLLSGQVNITAPGLSVFFTPDNFDPVGTYVYAWYNQISGGIVGPIIMGDWIEIGSGDFPDTLEWTLESQTTVGSVTNWTYSKLTYLGSVSSGASYRREIRYMRDDAGTDRSYRTSTQSFIGITHGQTQMFIYKIGSGFTDLDSLTIPPQSMGDFFPYIPVRIDNTFLSDTYLSSEFAQCKKAYKKATGSGYNKLINKISDNPSLGDIDHAYVVFGVSLNVLENASRRYLYRFFERLQQTQVGGPGIYNSWKAGMLAQQDVYTTWLAWKTAQSGGSGEGGFGDPEPPRPSFPAMPENEIRIGGGTGTSNVSTHFDMRLAWLFISSGSGSGKAKPTAKKGEVWFEARPDDETLFSVFGGGDLANLATGRTIKTVRLYIQDTNSSYRYMDLVGMRHLNYVYAYNSVVIEAADAIIDTDESGFVVPVHYDIWDDISLVQSTQMATASVFLIFNSYKIVKAKWYEKGVFQIVIVIVIAIVSVLLTGGAGIGLLGAHMAVGATLGLTGLAAAIAGAVINALAAMILTTLLTNLGSGIFGEQFGAVFAALVMLVIGGGINFETGSMTINWGDILKAENLLKLTSVIGETYAGYVRTETAGIGTKMANYEVNAKAEAEKIQQAFFTEFGYGAGKIDPSMFVDIASSSRILAESSDTFLTRTLMTGSEVAELSRDLIYNFVDYSNKLTDAYT